MGLVQLPINLVDAVGSVDDWSEGVELESSMTSGVRLVALSFEFESAPLLLPPQDVSEMVTAVHNANVEILLLKVIAPLFVGAISESPETTLDIYPI